jgi:hypothetical protein
MDSEKPLRGRDEGHTSILTKQLLEVRSSLETETDEHTTKDEAPQCPSVWKENKV